MGTEHQYVNNSPPQRETPRIGDWSSPITKTAETEIDNSAGTPRPCRAGQSPSDEQVSRFIG